ncbi:MAG: DUF4935 domain-containing protein [Cyanobacteria bacterium SZAS LIN-3]|nr:DUF4935 domain-containing protein [Cyanobacteria bacterium SZAS LIN-3]
MKDVFPGYFGTDENVIRAVWENCVMVFDTNILLDLFRIPQADQQKLLTVIEKLSGKLWLPHQVGLEFLRQKDAEIETQIRLHKSSAQTIKSSISGLLNQLTDYKRHHWIDFPALEAIFKDAEAKANEDIQRRYDEKISYEDVCRGVTDKLANIYAGKTGLSYPAEVLSEKLAFADRRMRAGIPPGFGDLNKSTGKQGGDVLVWLQMMEHAKEIAKPIVFVTRDSTKRDWLWQPKGRIAELLPELINEFREFTGQAIIGYDFSSFFPVLEKYLAIVAEPALVASLESVREAERVADSASVAPVDDFGRPLFVADKAASTILRKARNVFLHLQSALFALGAVVGDGIPTTNESTHGVIARLVKKGILNYTEGDDIADLLADLNFAIETSDYSMAANLAESGRVWINDLVGRIPIPRRRV